MAIKQNLIACFGDDLWSRRCLDLDPVVRMIEDDSNKGQLPDADQWVAFVKFLQQTCSGEFFTNDKQWSQLLNLMQISRKLNHRSVKFRDIIKNRTQIENAASNIRRLNESARMSVMVRELLKNLENNLANLKLRLINLSKSGSGNDSIELHSRLAEQIAELVKSRKEVREQCWLLVRTVRIELRNPTLTDDVDQLDEWTRKIGALETDLGLLDEFLNKYGEFLSGLMQLDPLIGANTSKSESTDATQTTQINKSVYIVVKEFSSLVSYAIELNNFLTKILRSTTKSSTNAIELQLMKLIRYRKHELVDDILDSRLASSIERTNRCKSTLNEITKTLRLEFGRFYFVNDGQLLQIIASDIDLVTTSQTPVNRALIKKLFNNSIDRFILDGTDATNSKSVIGVGSSCGEVVLFDESEKQVAIRKRINIHSLQVVRIFEETIRKLQRTLCKMLQKSLEKSPVKDVDYVDWDLPIQLIDVSEQVKFCRRVEACLGQESRPKIELETLLDEYRTRMGRLKLEEAQLKDKIRAIKMSVVVSLNIYFVTTLARLISLSGDRQELLWTWFKYTRYYERQATDTDNWMIEVRIDGICLSYKFDYLAQEQSELTSTNESADQSSKANGNQQMTSFGAYKRLIVTKTSERCFLVATHAIGRLKLGTSPYGPAGSGKTETMKALGRQLGCQVIVHNCDENNDCESLNRLVWGLAHTGLWCCFDEFNRLSKSTLSSVSATLERVQSGLRESRLTLVDSMGDVMSIDSNAAFFITLNPVGGSQGTIKKLYKGRRRLPANIRSLFVPVPMVQVQIDTIVSETLMDISLRANCTYALDRDNHIDSKGLSALIDPAESIQIGKTMQSWIDAMQVSSLNTCDCRCEWDLRLVIAILRRFEIESSQYSQRKANGVHELPIARLIRHSIELEVAPRLSQSEQFILRSTLDSVGLNDEEVPIGITSDLKLQSKVKEILANSMSLPTEDYHRSVMQLFNQLETHTGVVLMGPAKSGKTLTWQVLADSVPAIGRNIKWFAISPKSWNKSSLFGVFEQSTRKWTDGVLTRTIRNAIDLLQDDASKLDQVWIVLDGDIDPEWIECLNSVLDDNRILTLASGERLDFCPHPRKHIKLIFETTNMKDASPATISRLGLVYIERGMQQTREDGSVANIDVVNRLEDLIRVIRDARDRLYLLSISGADSDSLSDTIAEAFGNNRDEISPNFPKVYRYSCSPLTCASDLVDLLEEIPDDKEVYIVLYNVHLIEPEDEWQNISFLELLRFVHDYGIYYDNHGFLPRTFQKSNIILILTTRAATGNINERLVTSARSIRLASGSASSCRELKYIEETSGLNSLNESSRSIITVLGVSTKVANGYIESIEANKTADLFRFNNSEAAAKSLRKLEELVSLLSLYRNPIKSTMFILEELSSRLLGREMMQRLYNLLNSINNKKINADQFKFIYLCYSNDEQYDHLWTYWSRIGALYKLRSGNPQVDCDVTQGLEALLNEHSKLFSGDDARLLRRLMMIFKQRYTDVVSKQRKIYASGLTSLMNIESCINRLQASQEEDRRQLTEKRQEISNFIEAIDIKLKEAQSRNDKIDGFRQSQEKKTSEIAKKKQSIESNMSQVRAKIEVCRVDIDKCLRPEALNEIKSLRSPSKTIKDILDVLFVLLGEKEMSWSSMKSYLTRYSLRDELTRYDFQNNLNIILLQEVEALIRQRQDSFNIQQATRASTAVVPIVRWIQATLEYGKVMIKLKPMNDELAELQQENTEIEHKIARYKQEQQSLDTQIKADTQILDSLREKQAKSEDNYNAIEKELDEMRQVLRNSNSQRSRWKEKLKLIDDLYGSKELMDLAMLTAAILVTAYRCKEGDDSEFLYQRLAQLSTLLSIQSEPYDIVERLIDMSTGSISVDTERSCESQYSNEDLLNLFLVRTCLTVAGHKELDLSPLIPYLDMGTKGALEKNELIDYISRDNIVCGREELFYVDLGTSDRDDTRTEENMWMNSIRLGLQLDKVIVIDVSQLCETGQDLLDLIDLIRNCSNNRGLESQQIIRLNNRVIFVGHWNVPARFAGMEHFVIRLPVYSKKNTEMVASNAVERISEQIADQLVRYNRAELSQQCDQLYHEFRSRKSKTRLMELSLLEKLSGVETVDLFSRNKTSDYHQSSTNIELQLIKILNDLHLINVDLHACGAKWQANQDKLQEERSNYIDIARCAAEFYCHSLADLNLMNTFYEVSMKRYVELLMESSRLGTGSVAIDFREVLVEAMRPMRPKARRDFAQNLLESKRIVELITSEKDYGKAESLAESLVTLALRQASSLGAVLASLMDSLISSTTATGNAATIRDANVASSSDSNIRLMVVQHDASKASPQLEIDAYFGDLMKRHNDAYSNCSGDQPLRQAKMDYVRLYATGEQPDQLKRLEMQIAGALVNYNKISSQQTDRPDSGHVRICCICITNAHLAPHWMSNKLLACVQASLSTDRLILRKTKVLLITISESGTSGCDDAGGTVNQSTIPQVRGNRNTMSCANHDTLYRHADFKYWHDEMALNFADRYHLFMSTIGKQVLSRLEHRCSACKGELISVDLIDELVKRIVILHTSCQQLTLAAALKQAGSVWRRNYNFDYELLCFALGVFEHLVHTLLNGRDLDLSGIRQDEGVNLRHRLSKYLIEVVYGATHLETPEDEELFSKLLDKLFDISHDEFRQLLDTDSVEQRLIDLVK